MARTKPDVSLSIATTTRPEPGLTKRQTHDQAELHSAGMWPNDAGRRSPAVDESQIDFQSLRASRAILVVPLSSRFLPPFPIHATLIPAAS